MMIDDEDKSVLALASAFAVSTVAFILCYAVGKQTLRDVPAAFIVAVAFSLVALRVVYVRCAGERRLF
jgi:hypothetical protein